MKKNILDLLKVVRIEKDKYTKIVNNRIVINNIN